MSERTQISGVLDVELPDPALPDDERRAKFEEFLDISIKDLRKAVFEAYERNFALQGEKAH